MLRERQEIRTLALILFCYGIWDFLLFAPTVFPEWLLILLLAPVITFHSSLQHECIHGHPFTNRQANDLIIYLPIGLFMPYPRFRELHLTHHQRARITDPTDDPESWYVTQKDWAGFNQLQKWLRSVNNMLVGRMLVGPLIGLFSLIRADFRKILSGNRRLLGEWVAHFSLLMLLLIVIDGFSSMSILGYLFAAYLGMSLLMVRTFLEHQAHPDRRARSVLIDDKGPLRFLFLNNNLHAVHHAYPSVAWYRLPGLFRLHKERFVELNKGYFYRSYGDIIRAHALSQKEPVAFPLDPT